MLKVFIGYDPRQPVAFNVLAHSVVSRASKPVSIIRLQLNQLPIKRRGLTEFTFSRFLVPHLCNFEWTETCAGAALFLDADMLCLGDVYQIYEEAEDEQVDVWVVKHERRFEWPSLMLFKPQRCQKLTPEFVDDERNALYDFAWAEAVGSIPAHWNHLEGYDPPNPDAKLIHFTMGVPCWPETRKSEHADLWHKELKAANSTVSFEALMGKSVHVQHLSKLATA